VNETLVIVYQQHSERPPLTGPNDVQPETIVSGVKEIEYRGKSNIRMHWIMSAR